jgi:lysine-N-methylase
MSEQSARMLVPQYVRRFACIGGACEDTCCRGWQVPIDEGTYRKYRRCSDPELLVQMTANVTRNRKNPSPGHYAKVRLTTDAACPFLDADRLCSIQKRLGEEYLSDTCASYPRVRNIVNDLLEESMTLACPEAARLALLDPAVMEFDEIERPSSRTNGLPSLATDSIPPTDTGHYFWELRIFSIQVLQNRDYRVGDRLLLLGLFYRALQELVDEGKAADTRQLIASYTANIERGAYREHLADLRSQSSVPAALLRQIEDRSLLTGAVSPRYFECLLEFSTGIGNQEGAVVEDVARTYSHACEKYYEPFMTTHEHILENLLVNFVFRTLFPFNGANQPFNNYVRLAVYYSLVRTFLIGIAGFHKEKFATEHVLKLVQSFAKTIEHNPTYLTRLHAALMANGSASMAHMTLLINSGASGA